MAGATVAAAPTTAAVAPPTLFEEVLLQSLKKKKILPITVTKVMEDLLKAVINTHTNVTETLDIIPVCPTLSRPVPHAIDKIKSLQFP